MLKKIYRLSSVNIKNSKKISSDLFTLRFSENNLEITRFGFVISKKIDKKAVVRNSLKRKLSVSIEEIFDRIESGFDFVIYPSKKAAEANQEKISNEMISALSNNNFIK